MWCTTTLYDCVRDQFNYNRDRFGLEDFSILLKFHNSVLLYGDCLTRVTVNKLVVRVAQWIMKSLLTAATRVQSPWSTVLYVKGYGVRPLRFFPDTLAFSHTKDPLALTSVPTKDINISGRTCLSIVVKNIPVVQLQLISFPLSVKKYKKKINLVSFFCNYISKNDSLWIHQIIYWCIEPP